MLDANTTGPCSFALCYEAHGAKTAAEILCDPLTTNAKNLVKTNENITPDARRQMHLSLEIKLDTNGQGGGLQVALIVDGTTEEVSYGAC